MMKLYFHPPSTTSRTAMLFCAEVPVLDDVNAVADAFAASLREKIFVTIS